MVDARPYHPHRFVHSRARSLFWPLLKRHYQASRSPFLHPTAEQSPEKAFTGAVLAGLLMTRGPLLTADLSGGTHSIPCSLRAIDWLPPKSERAQGALPLDVLLLMPPSVAYPTPLQAVYITLDDAGCPYLVLVSLLPAASLSSTSSLSPHLVPGSMKLGLPPLLSLLSTASSLLPPSFSLRLVTADGSVLGPHELRSWYNDRLRTHALEEPVFPFVIKGLVLVGESGVEGKVEYLVLCEEEVSDVVAAIGSGVTRRLNGHVRLIGGADVRAVMTAEKDWQSDYFAHGMLDAPSAA